MSSIKTSSLLILLTFVLALAGCGNKNDKAVFNPESGHHPAGWVADHKNSAKADIETCVECHGEDLTGGIAKVSCLSCHKESTESVHPTQWGSYAYARHANYVASNGTSSCANAACHGTNLVGTDGIPSCTTCHGKTGDNKYSTHPATFGNFTSNLSNHAKYLKANTTIAKKTSKKSVLYTPVSSGLYASCATATCHGADLKGVFLTGPACYQCHTETTTTGTFSKHPASWSSAIASHGSYVVANGKNSCGTSDCHGLSFDGKAANGKPSTGPSCAKCHAAPVGSSSPMHPAGWNGFTKQGIPSHGLYVKTTSPGGLGGNYNSCATAYCHGTDARGVTGSGPSCYSCHTSGPTSEHPVTWTISPLRNHASYTKSNGYTSCVTSKCHGTDAKGVTGSGSSCYSCHTAGPASMHPLSWVNGVLADHGGYATTNGYASCATSYCHGINALGGTAGSLAPSCAKCHAIGSSPKHPAGWSNYPITHGLYVKSVLGGSYNSCATAYCHGTDARGVTGAGPSCYSCHTSGPTSQHPTAWTNAVTDHGSYVNTNGYTSCATTYCHGVNSTGVAGSGPSCFSCHQTTTSVHPTGWTNGALADHGSYVTTNGFTSCATSSCHGVAATGVTGSGSSCYSCHQAGPSGIHPQSWGAAPYYYDHITFIQSHNTYSCSTTLCHPTGHFVVGGNNTACMSCHTN